MHAVELTSVPTENRAVVVVHGLDLVLAPHLNSDLAWIQRAGAFTLRYPLVLTASIVLACVAWRFCRAGRRSDVAAKFAREAARKIKTACPDSWPFQLPPPSSHPVDNLFGFSFPSQSEIKC